MRVQADVQQDRGPVTSRGPKTVAFALARALVVGAALVAAATTFMALILIALTDVLGGTPDPFARIWMRLLPAFLIPALVAAALGLLLGMRQRLNSRQTDQGRQP